jgi:hypothetical protein
MKALIAAGSRWRLSGKQVTHYEHVLYLRFLHSID